jgi:serine/threonine protein kinase
MGEVWLAEQTRPVHRRVALKIIKAGMDTAQVVARFEAERQAVALMSHPAIAQLFDAGACRVNKFDPVTRRAHTRVRGRQDGHDVSR